MLDTGRVLAVFSEFRTSGHLPLVFEDSTSYFHTSVVNRTTGRGMTRSRDWIRPISPKNEIGKGWTTAEIVSETHRRKYHQTLGRIDVEVTDPRVGRSKDSRLLRNWPEISTTGRSNTADLPQKSSGQKQNYLIRGTGVVANLGRGSCREKKRRKGSFP